jgi:hypothetical protein
MDNTEWSLMGLWTTMDNIEQSLMGPWTTMDNIRGALGCVEIFSKMLKIKMTKGN